MQIGIIGLPLAGKTTLFNLLTGGGAATGGAAGRAQVNVGMAKVPDRRLDVLAAMFHPRKVTPAAIQFTDIAGFVPGEGDKAKLNAFLQGVRKSDALIHVIRTFESERLPHPLGAVDPARDAREVDAELILADLQVAESATARLEAGKRRSKEEEQQFALLERCRASLEEGRPVREMGLDDEAVRLLRGYAFLTERPLLIAVNVSEGELRSGTYTGRDELAAYCAEVGRELVEFCGEVELEIAALEDEADRGTFLAEYGLAEPGIARIARAAYRALGLVSFLTAGEDEVRAWPVRRETPAKQAAGKIHSDIEKGFIRAEVIAFADLEAAGSMKVARERGLLRLEGRDYPVQDGDVVSFRFNV